jgi:Domain of unknown function (DUF4281)
MEKIVTADQVFQIANPVALLGWIVLIVGIIFKKPQWRDIIAGQVFPTSLSLVYTGLIVFFWAKAEGGFDTLPNVQKLFTYPWAALAGWVHYLAFDLFMGAHISRRIMEDGISRLVLIVLLPLTFMFGPIGYFCFQISRLLFRKVSVAS